MDEVLRHTDSKVDDVESQVAVAWVRVRGRVRDTQDGGSDRLARFDVTDGKILSVVMRWLWFALPLRVTEESGSLSGI